MKFDDRPFIAIWETTQACDLACRHCRASAQPARDRGELTTSEGKRLLDERTRNSDQHQYPHRQYRSAGRLAALVATTGARLWSVFYVVPTGRAQADMMPSAQAVERSLEDFRNLCGGSRARAYALTGNFLDSDPLCAYVPPGYVDLSAGPPVRRRLEVC